MTQLIFILVVYSFLSHLCAYIVYACHRANWVIDVIILLVVSCV